MNNLIMRAWKIYAQNKCFKSLIKRLEIAGRLGKKIKEKKTMNNKEAIIGIKEIFEPYSEDDLNKIYDKAKNGLKTIIKKQIDDIPVTSNELKQAEAYRHVMRMIEFREDFIREEEEGKKDNEK